MTVMTPPPPPEKKPQPITLLELQYAAERHLDILMATRDVSRQHFGKSELYDREVRCAELIAEILYTISMDKDRYREFALDVRSKYGRWVHPSERGAIAAEEPGAPEE